MDNLSLSAINASLSGDYKLAISINKKIIKNNHRDVEALNRLGCAYIETGELEKAKKTYKKGLIYDHCNPIIIKNLKKIASLKGFSKTKAIFSLNPRELFLTEPGKTKITSLINLPPTNNFINLTPGTPVDLVIKKRSIAVYLNLTDQILSKALGTKTYLGAIPDDLSFRLLRLLKAGNKYQAYVRNIFNNGLTIFVKEVYRSKKYLHQPSFPELSTENNSNNQCQ